MRVIGDSDAATLARRVRAAQMDQLSPGCLQINRQIGARCSQDIADKVKRNARSLQAVENLNIGRTQSIRGNAEIVPDDDVKVLQCVEGQPLLEKDLRSQV